MAEENKRGENYVKRYLENAVESTRVLVDGDKANAYRFMRDAVENARALVDRILQEIEFAEKEIWHAIDVPLTNPDESKALAELTELKSSLTHLTDLVVRLEAARRGE